MKRSLLSFNLLLLFMLSASAAAQTSQLREIETVQTADLSREITEFLEKEVAVHLSDIKSLNPSPEKVVGAGATGEYTWGTFMRALGAYAEVSGKRTLAGRDIAREGGQIGLLAYRLHSTRCAQLYAVLALRHFGKD